MDLDREAEGQGGVEEGVGVGGEEALGLPHHAPHHRHEERDARAAEGERAPGVPGRELAGPGEDEPGEESRPPSTGHRVLHAGVILRTLSSRAGAL